MKTKLIFFAIVAVLALVGYSTYRQYSTLKSVNSYESCLGAKGSLVQESYPPTCLTRLGSRFIQAKAVPPIVAESRGFYLNKIDHIDSQKTYLDNDFHFSFQYPNSLNIVKTIGAFGMGDAPVWTFSDRELNLDDLNDSEYAALSDSIYINPSATQQSTVNYALQSGGKVLSDRLVGGRKAQVIYFNDRKALEYILTVNNGILGLAFYGVDEPTNLSIAVNQILSTFKFTN